MTIQEKVHSAVEDLPADATIEEVVERLCFMAKVEEGLAQARAGQTISHEEVLQRMKKWLQ
jgi:predicted transcriptional regulator